MGDTGIRPQIGVSSRVNLGFDGVGEGLASAGTNRFEAGVSWQPLWPSHRHKWEHGRLSTTAVAAQCGDTIQRGLTLAHRGALYTARPELIQLLRSIAGALDAHYGGRKHAQLLLAGLQALKEADDFVASGAYLEAEIDVSKTRRSHRTPVLLHETAEQISALLAMQGYYAFAQDRFAAASGGAAAASQALFALGRIYTALAEETSAGRSNGAKAIAFHQAALAVDSQNYAAANELGVLLARFGQLPEARSVLQHGVEINPLPETWHNLAVVHQRLGEQQLGELARREWQRSLRQAPGNQPREIGSGDAAVMWVDSETFVRGTLDSDQPATGPQRQAWRRRSS